MLSMAQLYRKRESTVTLVMKKLVELAPRAFSPWRESGIRYTIICSMLDSYAHSFPGSERDQMRELLRELDVEPWGCDEFLQAIAKRISTSGHILLIPTDGTPEGDNLADLRDALIAWTIHHGAHAYSHTPLFQWFLHTIDVSTLLQSIARYGTNLDAKGLLDLADVINALKKEHERSKNESPSTS